ncbi:MAG: purine-binding chemotaxis protein CheW [Candidatus Krumholzibacteriota bacterium]|nr:purine-binding chemotaxis protein CheW [Candidatus Krumholzibacteriota bacterium]
MVEKNETKNPGYLRFVSFYLDDEWYGQDIQYIQEVNKVQNIAEVPGSPEFILGVINLRGNVIPVMDIRARLGLPTKEITKKSRVIVVELDGSQLGLLVDGVHHVLEIPHDELSHPPDVAMTDRNKFIQGIGQVDDKLMFFIDIKKIFQEESDLNMTFQNKQAILE